MDKEIKLHLGCGKRDFGEDWDHYDAIYGSSFPHIAGASIEQLPYEAETVSLIYASHVLQYFNRDGAEILLSEWYDLLKYGGKLRLAVPDFKAMANLYIRGLFTLDSFLGPLYGKMIVKSEYIYHKTVYDFESISTLLKSVGFPQVYRYDWRETEHAHMDDCSQAYLPKMDKQNGTLISLNVEAVK